MFPCLSLPWLKKNVACLSSQLFHRGSQRNVSKWKSLVWDAQRVLELQIDLSQNKTSQGERVDKKLDAISCRDLRWTSTDFFFESSEVSTGIRLAPRWSQCVNHRLRPVEARGIQLWPWPSCIMGLSVWPTAGWSLRLGWSPWGRSACTFRCPTGLQKLKLEIPNVPGSGPNLLILLQFRRFFVVFSRTFSEINYARAMMSKSFRKLQVKFLVVSCVPCGEQAVKLQVPKNQSICDPFPAVYRGTQTYCRRICSNHNKFGAWMHFWFAWPNNPEQTSTMSHPFQT